MSAVCEGAGTPPRGGHRGGGAPPRAGPTVHPPRHCSCQPSRPEAVAQVGGPSGVGGVLCMTTLVPEEGRAWAGTSGAPEYSAWG